MNKNVVVDLEVQYESHFSVGVPNGIIDSPKVQDGAIGDLEDL